MARLLRQIIPVGSQSLGAPPGAIQGMGPGQELGMIRTHPRFPLQAMALRFLMETLVWGEVPRGKEKPPGCRGPFLEWDWGDQIPLRLELAARNWETMDSILSNCALRARRFFSRLACPASMRVARILFWASMLVRVVSMVPV